ncbi:MAG: asparagine synthase (glutamine-hydrolyzing) [Chitinophagales bacterium]
MCGIAGFFSVNKNISEQELHAMTNAMPHRGPDAAGFYVNEIQTVGLGHRRLSIIDLSTAANQPMFSHCGRYAMVFNGEVFNYLDIKQQLQLQCKTNSDSEVVLEAFAREGVQAVQRFNGMFAIAIYDIQEHTLYLFRDRLGIKPLNYFYFEKTLVFASEIKGLLPSSFVKKHTAIHQAAIYNFLHLGYIPEPHSIYTNIFKLPAGSYAVVKNETFNIYAYWKPEEQITESTIADFTQAKTQLNELLLSSVKYRMISDVPFGTFLSGGIDSSLVTALAQQNSSTPVKTFSIGFKEASHNESQYAQQVARHLGTLHTEFIVSEKDALELTDKIFTAYDEPYADSSALPTMLVSKLARQHVTMVLTGDGGDELFHGYGAYTWAKRLQHPLVKLLRKPLATALSWSNHTHKRGAKVVNYPNEQHLKSHIFSQEQYFFSQEELNQMLLPSVTQQLLLQEDVPTKRLLSAVEAQSLFDIRYYLKDDLLVKVDRATMQFSLEARTPFLDYRVVEFALNVHENLKTQQGVAKHLLKEVLYEYVPRQIFDRPKWGFAIPLAKWMKGELQYILTDWLSEENVTTLQLVQNTYVHNLKKRFMAGETYLYNRLFALALLHKWMKDNATK